MGVIAMESFKYPLNLTFLGFDGSMVGDTPDWQRVAGRGGRYALRYAGNGTGQLVIPFVSSTISYGFAAYHPADPSTYSDYYCAIIFFASGQSGSHSGRSAVSIGAGTNVGQDFSNYSGTSAWSFPAAGPTTPGWHWWNVVAKMNDGSAGYIRIYRDGVLVAEQAPDTSPTGGYTGLALNIGSFASSTTKYLDIADFILRDDLTIIPDSRVDAIDLASTTAAGWTGSDADQVDNHLLLNGTGPTADLASYVEADGVGIADTYTLATLPPTLGTIHAVQVQVIGATDDVSPGVSATVNGDASDAFSPTSGASSSKVWDTNPSGGAAWDVAAVEAATIGITT